MKAPRLACLMLVTCTSARVFAASAEVSAEVDWMGETIRGGMTSLALGILLAFAIAVFVERLAHLKLKHFAPDEVLQEAQKKWRQGQQEELAQQHANQPQLISQVIHFVAMHPTASPDLIYSGASDILSRRMKTENQIINLFAVCAGLAPLLGLLGTMIGMIEAFKLVELYGDEGGASMLAGSISKALITTAVGLIIAIGALVIYHGFKLKIAKLSSEIEEKIESFLNESMLHYPYAKIVEMKRRASAKTPNDKGE